MARGCFKRLQRIQGKKCAAYSSCNKKLHEVQNKGVCLEHRSGTICSSQRVVTGDFGARAVWQYRAAATSMLPCSKKYNSCHNSMYYYAQSALHVRLSWSAAEWLADFSSRRRHEDESFKQPSKTAVPFCAAVVICVALGSHLTPRTLLQGWRHGHDRPDADERGRLQGK